MVVLKREKGSETVIRGTRCIATSLKNKIKFLKKLLMEQRYKAN